MSRNQHRTSGKIGKFRRDGSFSLPFDSNTKLNHHLSENLKELKSKSLNLKQNGEKDASTETPDEQLALNVQNRAPYWRETNKIFTDLITGANSKSNKRPDLMKSTSEKIEFAESKPENFESNVLNCIKAFDSWNVDKMTEIAEKIREQMDVEKKTTNRDDDVAKINEVANAIELNTSKCCQRCNPYFAILYPLTSFDLIIEKYVLSFQSQNDKNSIEPPDTTTPSTNKNALRSYLKPHRFEIKQNNGLFKQNFERSELPPLPPATQRTTNLSKKLFTETKTNKFQNVNLKALLPNLQTKNKYHQHTTEFEVNKKPQSSFQLHQQQQAAQFQKLNQIRIENDLRHSEWRIRAHSHNNPVSHFAIKRKHCTENREFEVVKTTNVIQHQLFRKLHRYKSDRSLSVSIMTLNKNPVPLAPIAAGETIDGAAVEILTKPAGLDAGPKLGACTSSLPLIPSESKNVELMNEKAEREKLLSPESWETNLNFPDLNDLKPRNNGIGPKSDSRSQTSIAWTNEKNIGFASAFKSLGPDLDNDEYREKKNRKFKQKLYAEKIRTAQLLSTKSNINSGMSTPKTDPSISEAKLNKSSKKEIAAKDSALESRRKMMEYANAIRKPTLRTSSANISKLKPDGPEKHEVGKNRLQELELEHNLNKEIVDRICKELKL
ncbi:hypothetical protein HK098_004920 [Nowakowskiella sp. JEL0407]|nr:hypothetical protein HK098_004920 [Nowakowskiella sp. JEL0407]